MEEKAKAELISLTHLLERRSTCRHSKSAVPIRPRGTGCQQGQVISCLKTSSVSDRDGTVSDQTFGSASLKREAAHCHWRSSLSWQVSKGKHIPRLRLRALQQPPQVGEYSQQLIGGRNRLRFPKGNLGFLSF